MAKFTFWLDPATWLRGEGLMTSKLHRPEDGKQCCVGQLLLQAGFEVKHIYNIAAADEALKSFDGDYPESLEWLFADEGAGDVYEANDERGPSDQLRIDLLRGLFEKHGVTMKVKWLDT